MAEQNEGIQVAFGANITGLTDGLKQAVSGVQGAVGQIKTQFASMQSAVTAVSGAFATVTAVLAGGKMFKDAISGTMNWTMEVNKLSRMLQLNMADASAWAVALHGLGVDTETMVSIVQKLQGRLSTSAEAFSKWGVTVKDGRGVALPMAEVVQNLAGRYTELEKTGQGNKMLFETLGRSWGSFLPIIRLTSERLAEAKKEAHELGLEVGTNGVAQAREYKEAMNKLSLIGQAFGNVIGRELTPFLKDLAKWLGSEGGDAIKFFTNQMKFLVSWWYALGAIIETVYDWFKAIATMMRDTGAAVFQALGAAANHDYVGAWNAIKNGLANVKNDVVVNAKDIAETWSNTYDRIKKKWSEGDTWKTGEKPTPAIAEDPQGPTAGKSRMKEWEEQLAAQEASQSKIAAANGMFYEKSLEDERKFWDAKLPLTLKGSEEQVAVKRKIDQISMQEDKDRLEKQKQNLETQIADERYNLQRKLALLDQEQAMYAKGTKGFEEVERKKIQVRKEVADQLKKLEELRVQAETNLQQHQLDMEEQEIRQRKALGVINDQEEINALMNLEERRYQIKLAAMQKEAALELDPVKYREKLNQIEQVQQQHDLKMQQMNDQLTLTMRNRWSSLFDAITSGFTSSIQGLINGTMTWGQAFKNILNSAINSLIDFFVKWGLEEAKKFALSLIFGKATRSAEVMGAASVYAVNAMSSVAAIPVVGWAMAPAVGAAAFAEGLGFLASAAGGWETVPHDTLAMIHKDEQVLPASYASGLRQLINGGGAQGGQPVQEVHQHTWNVQTLDASSFEEALSTKFSGALVRVQRELVRNGRM